MTRKIRWGILSTAGIGRKRVIPALQQTHNGEVVAVASRDAARARQFADQMGIPKSYGSYEDLLADPDVDAIYNPLPNSEHALWSIRCAEAGKPVLCEKPFASTTAETETMVAAFTQRNLLIVEAFMWRFHPQAVEVKRLVESGAIGSVQTLNATFCFTIQDSANIRLSSTLAGGGLMDVGCYCINFMRWITGEEPVAAQAFASFGAASGVDENLVALLHFPSGALGHFDCGLRQQFTRCYEVRGTHGRILAENAFTPQPNDAAVIRLWQGDQYDTLTLPPANHYTLMAEDFADALLEGRPPRYTAADGIANMRAVEMVLAAARR
jgi:D-xylose 1-dehydrogenase (NADP+, D-xylono-1,5-lactone-forming)